MSLSMVRAQNIHPGGVSFSAGEVEEGRLRAGRRDFREVQTYDWIPTPRITWSGSHETTGLHPAPSNGPLPMWQPTPHIGIQSFAQSQPRQDRGRNNEANPVTKSCQVYRCQPASEDIQRTIACRAYVSSA
eukprot:TRINITY_DN2381_c0_g1_i3.p6 TRINITY_DN2381_c0_g1~~TRINITY_DN2381_c0_g1_i3.p6  ORF type:complete len:131 (+),score=5.57 TRINITY_DN2381_c0_g1_i3:1569-1961(+)